jgi:glycosyltransferase involved in cell wall biosynthesis
MKKKNHLLFSIIIPAFNEERNLSKCLKSIINQGFPRSLYEIIVVNNASTDRTVNIARQHKVKIIHEKRKGIVYARHAGFKKSQGKVIVNLDADCITSPLWLKTLAKHFNDKDTILVTGPCYQQKTPGESFDFFSYLLAELLSVGQKLFKKPFAYYGGNVAIRKSALQKIGGYDLSYSADQLSLLDKLKKYSHRKVIYDKAFFVTTPPRRTEGRFLKFIFKEVLYLYFINNLYVKITGKSLGNWEDIR